MLERLYEGLPSASDPPSEGDVKHVEFLLDAIWPEVEEAFFFKRKVLQLLEKTGDPSLGHFMVRMGKPRCDMGCEHCAHL